MATYSNYAASTHVSQPSCKYPGCSRPRYKEVYGRVHDFCGRTHAQEYSKRLGYSYAVGSTTSVQRKQKSSTPATGAKQPMRAVHYSTPTAVLGARHGSNKIRFYNRGEPYYEFTNFYPCRVYIDGKMWPTTEHYFQAQKFVGTPYLEKIRKLPTPRDAFQLSRDPQVSRWRRVDWESVKDEIMLKALRIKFSDSVRLRDMLRGTGEKELIEHTSNDSYWGDGGNGTGQNKLGKLLMEVRRELKSKYGPYTPPASLHVRAYDDSGIVHQQTPTYTAPRLRRSNSMSSITDRQSYSPVPVSVTGGHRPNTYSRALINGTGTKPGGAHVTPTASKPTGAQKAAKKGLEIAKEGKKVAAKVTNAITPSHLRTHTSRSNQSSVTYNIINHKGRSTYV